MNQFDIRREEILKRKAIYDNYKAERDRKENEAYNRYREAEDKVQNEIISKIKSYLGDTSNAVSIICRSFYDREIEVVVKVDNSAALIWTWSICLNRDNSITKESNSWSGFNATTTEHIKSLKQSVQILEILNNIDWETILIEGREIYPKYKDYQVKYEDEEDAPKFEKFDTLLRELDIEEIIANNQIFRSKDQSYYTYIVKETPKQYQTIYIQQSLLKYYIEQNMSMDQIIKLVKERYIARIAKEKLLSKLNYPLEKINIK